MPQCCRERFVVLPVQVPHRQREPCSCVRLQRHAPPAPGRGTPAAPGAAPQGSHIYVGGGRDAGGMLHLRTRAGALASQPRASEWSGAPRTTQAGNHPSRAAGRRPLCAHTHVRNGRVRV